MIHGLFSILGKSLKIAGGDFANANFGRKSSRCWFFHLSSFFALRVSLPMMHAKCTKPPPISPEHLRPQTLLQMPLQMPLQTPLLIHPSSASVACSILAMETVDAVTTAVSAARTGWGNGAMSALLATTVPTARLTTVSTSNAVWARAREQVQEVLR